MTKLIFASAICVVFILAFVSAAPPPAHHGPTTKTTKKPPSGSTPHKKVSCMVCRGLGDDCKSNKVDNTCDKCVKFTGIASDPNAVPSFVWNALEKQGDGGAKKEMSQHKGKKTTIRGCATQDLIEYATFGDDYSEEGCSEYDDFFGFNDVTACLCKKDCK